MPAWQTALEGTSAPHRTPWRLSVGSSASLFFGAQDLVQLRHAPVQFLAKRGEPLDGVAADFLVGAVGHAVEISDVRLQLGLAVADGRRDQVRCQFVQARQYGIRFRS